MLQFSTHNQQFSVEPSALVIAGWTGRDRAAIEHHIEELAAIGVPRPSKVPLYYRVSISNLTQSSKIQVVGENTSGEVEPVLFKAKGQWWLTVGSDHTDRSAEEYSVALSKQVCPKVVGVQAWALEEVKDHLDQIQLLAKIGEEQTIYQKGSFASIRPLMDLLSGYSNDSTFSDGFFMSCGTLGAIGGIRPSARFEMSLHDPKLSRTISASYEIQSLPLIS